jgi:hypothetical protein
MLSGLSRDHINSFRGLLPRLSGTPAQLWDSKPMC